MTSDEATALQQQWGDKPCNHPDIIAERDADGRATDNWRCTDCGLIVEYDEWRRSLRK
jgi:hypothetical protein